jgi:signal transduction histidine kinase
MVSAALTLSLPILAVVFVFLMRRHFLLPLYNLRDLMSALGRPDYSRVSTSDLDPLLRPVFENYNHMVERLAELERNHRDRQHSLEEEVRVATRALLKQQRELSQAERLAAVGELAAGVAHELRNPLAGIQMALSGIRQDAPDAESRARLDLVIAEIKRVTRLLNDTLNLSRRTPELPVELELVEVVNELATLLRYQLPEDVSLVPEIPRELTCRLPEDGLRQALLNLILNGAQAIGHRPGRIVVSVVHSHGRLKISVSDDGPGFPDELLEGGVRTFSTRRPGGTGLGLATVRRFARDLGGDLILHNVDSNGACATIDVPAKVVHA